ncbi:MAG: DNA alkylation repair protein [Thermoplasmata archaeon]
MMALDARKAREEIVRTLHAHAKPGDNAKLQAYVGSPYPVLGLSTQTTRSMLHEFRSMNRTFSSREVNGLARALWSGPTFDEKAFAIALLDAYLKILDDASWKIADRWVDEALGWALSDSLAAGPIAAMVRPKPGRYQEVLRWTKSPHFWRRRAATYAMHDFVLAGELEKPFQLLEKLLYDDEFWVQRAVGTWLRESWKKDRRTTEAFLRKHVRGLPKVVITVATERAPKAFRDELRSKR